MDEDLFRREAIDAFKQRGSGEPIVPMPMGWVGLAALLIGLLIAGVVFIVTQDYARKEQVVGWLRHESGEFAVTAPTSGTVADLQVADGDVVAVDDVLFSIRSSDRATTGAVITEGIKATIQAEERSLREQLRLIDANLSRDVERNRLEQQTLNAQLGQIASQLSVSRSRMGVLAERYQRLEPLVRRGSASQVQLQAVQLEWLDAQERQRALQSEQASISGRVRQLDAQQRQLPTQAAERKVQIEQRLSQLERTLIEAEVRSGVAVPAPRSGTIVASTVREGTALQVGERALSIVDAGSELQAELFLPSRTMARISPGLEVRIFYDAFPHRRYGIAQGTILSVSDTVFRPEEIPSALAMEEAAYRAKVALEAQSITAFDREHALRGGMTLRAEIILERQNFLQWLLEPLRN